MMPAISCLAVTAASDLPETHLLIGLRQAGIDIDVLTDPNARYKHLLLDHKVPVFELPLKGRIDKAASGQSANI